MCFENSENEIKRPFYHKHLLIITAVYFTGLAIAGLLVYRASPGPESQEILGVGIGDWRGENGIALFSGRRLACDKSAASPPFTTMCEIEIAGKPLQIHAARNSTSISPLDNSCTAFYDGKTWPCRIGSRHVHVHWFAYIEDPLGLSSSEMNVLRRHYFFENLGEDPFLYGGVITAVINTILLTANYLLWFWGKMKRRVLLLTAVVMLPIIFYGSLIITVLLTNGFWD